MQVAQVAVQPKPLPVSDRTDHRPDDAVPGDEALAGEPIDGGERDRPGRFLALFAVLFVLFLAAIAFANMKTAPWIHSAERRAEIAEAMLAGKNYGLFDLNIDIRGVRRAQFAQLERTPRVVLLGASHWQEAHADLLPSHDLFNAHVHRDYYDDTLAMVEVMLSTGHLPESLIVTIRDATFTAAADRKDYLWTPFVPEYRAMEARLGLERRPWYEDFPLRPMVDLFSLPTAVSGAVRWLKADERPGVTEREHSATLDILLADGSVNWSQAHLAAFTPARARRLALEHAEMMRRDPPVIDAAAVEAMTATLALLRDKGVNVVLAHPPFNPIFYDAVRGTAYAEHLSEVRALTRRLAERFGATVAGSFDPRAVGCEAAMYIDSEHSGPPCLRKLLRQIAVHLPE